MAICEPDPWRIGWANPAFWQAVGRLPTRSALAVEIADLPGVVGGELGRALQRFVESDCDATTGELLAWPEARGEPRAIRLCRVGSADERTVGMIVHRIAHASSRSHLSEPRRIDPLTGLPDRSALLGRLAALLQGERTSDRQFALIFLDLDNFKRVNDEFGHLVGDMVLQEAARRIVDCVRAWDMVSRYGGDEFVALIEGATAMADVQPVVERIRTSLDRPIGVGDGEVQLSLSAGVAFAAEGCGSAEELLGAADQAMYAAKRSTAAGESREP